MNQVSEVGSMPDPDTLSRVGEVWPGVAAPSGGGARVEARWGAGALPATWEGQAQADGGGGRGVGISAPSIHVEAPLSCYAELILCTETGPRWAGRLDPGDWERGVSLDLSAGAWVRPVVALSYGPLDPLPGLLRGEAPPAAGDGGMEALARALDRLGPPTLVDLGRFPGRLPQDPLARVRGLAERDQLRAALELLDLEGDQSCPPAAAALRGLILRRLGRAQEAEPLLRALALRGGRGVSATIRADARRELARLMIDTERRFRAGPLLRAALEAHRQAGAVLDEARDNLVLGVMAFKAGRWSEALMAYGDAEALTRGRLAHKLRGAALLGLGQSLEELGRLREAAARVRDAQRHLAEVGDRLNLAACLGTLGAIALEERRWGEAVEHLEGQRDLLKALDLSHLLPGCHLNLCLAARCGGDLDSARAWLRRAGDLPAHVEPRRLGAGIQVNAAEIALDGGDAEAAISALAGLDPRDGQMAWGLRWRVACARGRALDVTERPGAEDAWRAGVEAMEEVRASVPSQLRVQLLDLSRQLWDGWIAHQASGGDPEDTLLAVERSRARGLLDAILLARTDARDDLHPQALSRDVWRRAVGEGGAAWVLHALPDRLISLWVSASGVEMDVLPIPRWKLEAVRQQLLDGCDGSLDERRATEAVDTLSRWLMPFVGGRLEGLPPDSSLCVSAPGSLHGFPFAALLDRRGQPLVSRLALHYAPSLHALAQWRERAPVGAGALIFADPDRSLAGARAEGDALAVRLPGARLLSGEAAHGPALMGEVGPLRDLHISCHAEPGQPGLLHMAAAPDAEGPRGWPVSWQQALRSGELPATLLAEIAPRADRVFLGACGTAQGALSPSGEGVDLLSHAFLTRGARQVVATAWRAPDEMSRRISLAYYGELLTGTPGALALARAQRQLMAEHLTSDRYRGVRRVLEASRAGLHAWAAFTLIGADR